MINYIKILFLSGLLLTCKNPSEEGNSSLGDIDPSPSHADSNTPQVLLTEIPQLTDSLILTAIFGNARDSVDRKGQHHWRAGWKYRQFADIADQPNYPYPVEDALLARIEAKYQYQNGERCIAVFGTSPVGTSCPVCGGLMGAAIFSKSARGWKPETVNRYFLLSGSNGEPSKAVVHEFGKNKPVIVFTSAYASRGVTSVSLQLGGLWKGALQEIGYIRDRTRVRALLEQMDKETGQIRTPAKTEGEEDPIALLEDNTGNCSTGPRDAPYDTACYKFSGTVSFPESPTPYYDMVIRYEGTRPRQNDVNRAVPFQEKWQFRFANGIYFRVQ